MIKCVVSDLDGTLIKPDDTIEDRTWYLLQDLMAKGVEVIIATGRDRNMVVDFLRQYPIQGDLILNNGAERSDTWFLRHQYYPMNPNAFRQVSKILVDRGYLLAIHTDQGKYAFVDRETFWERHYALLMANKPDGFSLPKKTFTTREGYLRDLHYAKDADEMIEKGIQVLKIDARHIDGASCQGVRSQLDIEGLDFSSSYEDNIEITSNVSNKGKLLSQLMDEKGYDVDEVAVFGDGLNDCAMLQGKPYSFAPANACKEAKASSRFILSSTCEQGAVGEGIEKLISWGQLP